MDSLEDAMYELVAFGDYQVEEIEKSEPFDPHKRKIRKKCN